MYLPGPCQHYPKNTRYGLDLASVGDDTQDHEVRRNSVAYPGGTETILVVDDESVVRNLCTAVLKNAGYKVIAAEDGYAAIQICKAASVPVHLALLDVRMPRMSGPELIVELLDCLVPQNLDIRFILMSGYADPDVGDPAHRNHRRY